MSQPATVRACPLCASKQITVIQVDSVQAAAGVTCILKCTSCSAVVKLCVMQTESHEVPTPKD